jgi:hypothetical protein
MDNLVKLRQGKPTTRIFCAFHFYFRAFYIGHQPITFDVVIVVLLTVFK